MKLNELMSQLTLEEKASLCSGLDFWRTKGVERLGIPSVMVSDGPHGLRKQEGEEDHLGLNKSKTAVCFPAGCAAAASFDPELVGQMGQTLGQASRSEGIAILLGPAVNIKRSPLCGRNFEYYSEDPYLSGQLATAFIKGVQSCGVGTSIKHFAANNQEYYRLRSSSDIDERTLREIYLPAFETAVKEAAPWSVMCSYNKVNGVFSAENSYLLNTILREEWGFEGAVVTDWGAVTQRVKCLIAGTDLEMPGTNGNSDKEIVKAVRGGTLDEAVLNRAVERILRIVLQAVANQADGSHVCADLDAAHEKAVCVAKESAVLLANDGTLPLFGGKKVAYIGEFAVQPRFQGGGSSHVNAYRVDSALGVAQEKKRGVTYAKGFPFDSDSADKDEMNRAIAAAKDADIAVIFAGLPDSYESEGYDRPHMRLPDCQNELISAVAAVQPNVVVVLHNGSPVECPWAAEVSAVLEMYLAGEGVGMATDALLWGEANPCGRLAESFPVKLEDNPSFLNFHNDSYHVRYAESVFVGYRYYDTKKMNVRWPFGHGLSYTQFTMENARLSSPFLSDNDEVTISVDVTNTGSVRGKEVVQLYVQDTTNAIRRPEKELKGFAKVDLAPAETKTVNITINKRSLSWYSEEMKDWYAASGIYRILIARSSRDIVTSLDLELRTEQKHPLRIGQDTTLGEIMANPNTAAVFSQMMNAAGTVSQESFTQSDSQNAGMQQAMMNELPLRTLCNFGYLSEEQLEQLLNAFRFSL